MKTYSIYGTPYELRDGDSEPIDSYAYKGELLDDMPTKGKYLGVITMDDGTVVECYGKSSKVIIIIITLLLVIAAAVAAFFIFSKKDEIAIGGTFLSPSVNKNIVTFNGIMSANSESGMCQIDFVNGDYEATIQLVGDDISSDKITVAPNEVVREIPVTINTKSNVAEVLLRVESEGDTGEFESLVEVPDNDDDDYGDPEEIAGLFSGELILNGD